MDLAAPDLERPVLMIHGLNGHADQFINIKNWLCGNQENHYGGVYRAGHSQEFYERQSEHPGANVFALEIADNIASPKVVKAEVTEAIQKICAATGCADVDVITHSMGALDARLALHGEDPHIHRIAMLAPPNQGAYSADLGMLAQNTGVYHTYPEGRTGAMEFLRIPENNPDLADLNGHWREDRDKLSSAAILATQVMPTADYSWTLTNRGDGLVTAARANLDDTPLYIMLPDGKATGDPGYGGAPIWTLNHVALLSQPYTYKFLAEFLEPHHEEPAPLQPPAQFELF